ncbi:hypothetical protein GYH30_052276 [Glycine max]|nr:hypothetical protein GYH30_052276 [Glycine max]
MTLLLSNILPSDHNADLPLRKYQLGLHPQDTQWTRRSPTGPWGFQLWLRASVSPTGCPFPPARGSAHKSPSGPGGAQQDPGVSSSGYGPLSVLQGARPPSKDRARKTPSGPGEVQQGLGVSSSDYGLLSVLRSACHPGKVIRSPTNKAFIKKYCAPRQAQGETPQQLGDGWQRATNEPPPPLEFISAHPQKRLEHCLRHMADQ